MRALSRPPSSVPRPLFRYTEHAPSPTVNELVLSYWSFQADAPPPPDEPYTVFPDGCASVACVRSGHGAAFVAVVGPRVTHFRPPFVTGTRIWGIRFWPDAIGPALGVSAVGLREVFGALPSGFPPAFAELDTALPRSALAMRLAPSSPGWSEIAAGTGFVDHAHLTREFVALAGVPPTIAAEQLRTTAHRGVRP